MKTQPNLPARRHVVLALLPLLPLLLLGLLVGCDGVTDPEEAFERTFLFEDGLEDWSGDFAEFSQEMREGMDLVFEHRALPSPLDTAEQGLYLAATNISDDVFMYLKREVPGLMPNTTYEVTYQLEVASNAPSGCAGIGGPPGEAVVMKVGVSTIEPASVQEGSDVEFNLDKDNQNDSDSPDTSVLEVGTIANGIEECTGEVPYQMIPFSNAGDPLQITTDATGQLWLFVGTDSGFEGRTGLYYDAIEVSIVS